ncbi:thiamine pyrophosphate-dependent enzyme [Fusibacter bizertensis]|uniref:Thiamine pyrophosphate-dependent enzyme n=1 Tax=Fusibacter bizertensis TaxID=1488331 RepID=A0ABT6NE22_9FIRM|nr:thiamine pyrophosphate-dependent enzyme [Fusibacter bizertensis]MDH8678678.1 thiamine pyrophosphate-dependent enzyme [Fusibacter bizertensis]
MAHFEFDENIDIAWCPGCGNFTIRKAIIEALQELNLNPTEVVMSSGIGQAAKMPQYINTNFFNGLHGRGLPIAVAIKAVNPELTVIAEGGDGDMYGEGGNHFIHNIRRNPNIVHIVHDNMVYGLTKGQAAPTSAIDFETPVQVNGVINDPFNPMPVALSLGATFVARAFSGDIPAVKKVIKAAIAHDGYALIDIFHPCVSFNKINTFKWFKDNSYNLDDTYDASDFTAAMEKALDTEKYALGILYQNKDKVSFNNRTWLYQNDPTPIVKRVRDISQVNALIR